MKYHLLNHAIVRDHKIPAQNAGERLSGALDNSLAAVVRRTRVHWLDAQGRGWSSFASSEL